MPAAVTGAAAPVGALCDALQAASARAAESMRLVTDPRPTAIGVWSIGETANHLSGSAGYFLAAARELAEPERLEEADAAHARALAADPERDPRILADRLERNEQALIAWARAVEGDPPVQPFAGVVLPLSGLLGIELGEVLVHGFDMARAAGLPWRIDPQHALLVHRAYGLLLPHLVDAERAAGLRLRLELRIRGAQPQVIVIENGDLRVEPECGQRADCHLSVDPVTYLLLTWNRIGPLRPLLQGRLLLWGRRPWRMSAFKSAIRT
jgi:uncharacterized protein (TIGR03083 family)